MSFRVGCIGGNTIHVDHTQYGTLPFSQRPTDNFRTIWPVGFSLDEMMKLAWRVRKWKITGTAAWTFTDSGGSDSDTIVYDASAQDPSAFPPFDTEEHFPRKKYVLAATETVTPDERYLVVSYGPTARYIATPQVGSLWRLRASFQSFGPPPPTLQFPSIYYDSTTQLFYPFIQFSLGMRVSPNPFIPSRAEMTSNLASIPSVGVNGRGSEVGTITLLGRVIKLYSVNQLTGLPSSGTLTMSGTFVMEPAEGTAGTKPYWPFANSADLPVYNEDTGAVLNGPFS